MSRIKEKSEHANKPLDVYIGHEAHDELIYIGGPYYDTSAQLHLDIASAKWLAKKLPKYIKRAEKCK